MILRSEMHLLRGGRFWWLGQVRLLILSTVGLSPYASNFYRRHGSSASVPDRVDSVREDFPVIPLKAVVLHLEIDPSTQSSVLGE